MSDNVDINALLDSSLDDLADLPEFKPFPAGAHKVLVTFETKTVAAHPCVEMTMKAVETLELANPAEDQPLVAGAETNVLFMLDNEIGQGKLKEALKPLAEATGMNKTSDILNAANGMEVTVVTKVRTNSKDTTQKYTDIVSLSV